MREKYIKVKNLSISEKLLNFINNELLPGTKLEKNVFWQKFDKCVHELLYQTRPKNFLFLTLYLVIIRYLQSLITSRI